LDIEVVKIKQEVGKPVRDGLRNILIDTAIHPQKNRARAWGITIIVVIQIMNLGAFGATQMIVEKGGIIAVRKKKAPNVALDLKLWLGIKEINGAILTDMILINSATALVQVLANVKLLDILIMDIVKTHLAILTQTMKTL
tara:strand:- start:354 stop:776 length:423 start_codon:yes stop_codon:yes gene_type:complete